MAQGLVLLASQKVLVLGCPLPGLGCPLHVALRGWCIPGRSHALPSGALFRLHLVMSGSELAVGGEAAGGRLVPCLEQRMRTGAEHNSLLCRSTGGEAVAHSQSWVLALVPQFPFCSAGERGRKLLSPLCFCAPTGSRVPSPPLGTGMLSAFHSAGAPGSLQVLAVMLRMRAVQEGIPSSCPLSRGGLGPPQCPL